jgi:hypothetical protein
LVGTTIEVAASDKTMAKSMVNFSVSLENRERNEMVVKVIGHSLGNLLVFFLTKSIY